MNDGMRHLALLGAITVSACKPSSDHAANQHTGSAYGAASGYEEHMTAGEKLENGMEWTGALKEYEAALATKPGDPRALTEIGWTSFYAGDMKRAREASTLAVAA